MTTFISDNSNLEIRELPLWRVVGRTTIDGVRYYPQCLVTMPGDDHDPDYAEYHFIDSGTKERVSEKALPHRYLSFDIPEKAIAKCNELQDKIDREATPKIIWEMKVRRPIGDAEHE